MKKLISFAGLNILFLVFMSFKLCESANKSNKISIDDFPMTVGSQWTYLRTDSVYHYGDPTREVVKETVAVQITSEQKGSNQEQILRWIRNFVNAIDTEYAVVKGDTVTLFTSIDSVKSSVVFRFVFPLKVGKRWSGHSTFRDSDYYAVMRAESVTVPAGKFSNAYLIFRRIADLGIPGVVKFWVVPKIGIVKMAREDFIIRDDFIIIGKEYYPTDYARKKFSIWELIRYDIKK